MMLKHLYDGRVIRYPCENIQPCVSHTVTHAIFRRMFSTKEDVRVYCEYVQCVGITHDLSPHPKQCFFFSRNISFVTPKIVYFHYLKKSILDESIQKRFYVILKTEALIPRMLKNVEPGTTKEGLGRFSVDRFVDYAAKPPSSSKDPVMIVQIHSWTI